MIKRKKRNPRDEELINKIKIIRTSSHNRFLNVLIFKYTIYLNDIEIGNANIVNGNNYITTVNIEPEYKRKGLASYLYNYIEKDLGIKLQSNASTKEGKAFWNNRMKRNPIKRKIRRNPIYFYMIHRDEHGYLEIEKGTEDEIYRLADHFPNNLILNNKELKELFNIMENYV